MTCLVIILTFLVPNWENTESAGFPTECYFTNPILILILNRSIMHSTCLKVQHKFRFLFSINRFPISALRSSWSNCLFLFFFHWKCKLCTAGGRCVRRIVNEGLASALWSSEWEGSWKNTAVYVYSALD